MSTFVEDCRREWKRLGVADAVANEMAADLEADLAEAEAEGASAEDVLGNAAFDARSFAASWAAERGVVPPPSEQEQRLPRRSRVLLAVAASVSVAAIGAGLAILATPSGSARVALAHAVAFRAAPATAIRPFGPARVKVPRRFFWHVAGVAAPRAWLVPPPPPAAAVPGFAVHVSVRNVYLHATGAILLIVGIVGLILSMLYWSPWQPMLTRSR